MAIARNIVLAGLLGLSAVAAIPATASAHDGWGHRYSDDDDDDGDRWRERRGYRDGYEYRGYDRARPRSYHARRGCQTSGTTGAILGGAVGALLGRGIDTHGDRAVGTILGAGGGALLGREVDRNHRC